MTDKKSNIVLITTGQPALNPRLVKEADILSNHGYQVTVIYLYWNDWGTEIDKSMLLQKKWLAIRVGGTPKQNKFLYWYSKVRFKFCRSLYKGYGILPEDAKTRGSWLLQKAAKKNPADLYIAHNLGALPAAVKVAKYYGAKCGFDAEDFHRHEISDDKNHTEVILSTLLEDHYIPKVSYLTASSPLISSAYSKIFKRECSTILNVFCKTKKNQKREISKAIKLFWFSQTIGLNRGIETVIDALNLTEIEYEFHIMGNSQKNYSQALMERKKNNSKIYLHPPIAPEEIFDFAAQFDIGIASEPGFSLNNNYALSNKIFTYMQVGLAVVASNTPAQTSLLGENTGIGSLYDHNNPKHLIEVLNKYHFDRTLLVSHQNRAFELGQTKYNWENERTKFLHIINAII